MMLGKSIRMGMLLLSEVIIRRQSCERMYLRLAQES